MPSTTSNPVTPPPEGTRSSASALTLAGLAALLASSCCVLPLVFALVGISGAWIVHMRALEAYTPVLLVVAFAALAFAAWRLYRPARGEEAVCRDGTCSPAVGIARRWFWLVAVLTLIPLLVPLVAPLFYE